MNCLNSKFSKKASLEYSFYLVHPQFLTAILHCGLRYCFVSPLIYFFHIKLIWNFVSLFYLDFYFLFNFGFFLVQFQFNFSSFQFNFTPHEPPRNPIESISIYYFKLASKKSVVFSFPGCILRCFWYASV